MSVRLPLVNSVYWFFLGLRRVLFGRKHTCEIDLTSNCNLQCKHCYFYAHRSHEASAEIPLDEWKQRFDQLSAQGIRKVLFVGGEPALRLDVLELADTIFPVLHIISNGTIKVPKTFNHTIFLSIDGLQETNDRIRGEGTFAKAMENYHVDQRVVINLTLFQENYLELEDVVKLSVEHGFSGVACNIYCSDHADGPEYPDFIPDDTHKKIIEELKRVQKLYPSHLLFTKSMIDWFEHPDHRQSCYWREKVDHYDVDFKRRTCFMETPDCARCGCYAGAFSTVADKPLEILIYSAKYLYNRIH